MARLQVVSARGDVDNQAPIVYRGRLEELMGCLRLIEANFIEIYAALGSGTGVGSVLVTDAAPGSGSVTGYSPSGFGLTSNRLDIAANVANTTINDLPVGGDGQSLRIRNTGTGILILTNANSGSTAATRFSGASDVSLVPGEKADIMYYGGGVNRWVM